MSISLHIAPCSSTENAVDGAARDTKLTREFADGRRSRFKASSNLSHVFFDESCVAMLGTGQNPRTSLRVPVVGIVHGRAKKQVARITTSAVVATGTVMTNLQAIWDRAVCEFPRKTMRSHLSALVPPDAIAVGKGFTDPQPTRVGTVSAINGRPKVVNLIAARGNTAGQRTVLALSHLHPVGINSKGGTTGTTRDFNTGILRGHSVDSLPSRLRCRARSVPPLPGFRVPEFYHKGGQ